MLVIMWLAMVWCGVVWCGVVWCGGGQVNPRAALATVAGDLSDLTTLDATLDAALETGLRLASGLGAPFRVVLFNNAADLSVVQAVSTATSLKEFAAGFDFNVVSALWTTKRFLAFVEGPVKAAAAAAAAGAGTGAGTDGTGAVSSRPSVVVNVSSLAAIAPFPSMANYCAGKAARDAFHGVVAAEYGGDAGAVLALNYSPGPMATDMLSDLKAAPAVHDGVKAFLKDSVEKVCLQSRVAPCGRCVGVSLSWCGGARAAWRWW